MEKYEIIRFKENDLEINVRVFPNENTVWLTQKEISVLFETTISNVNIHLKNILEEGELDNSVFKESLITANDGKIYLTKRN